MKGFFNKLLKLILIVFAISIAILLFYTTYRFVVGQYSHYLYNARIEGNVEKGGIKYYLSPNGNDDNVGTSSANAWQTIERANRVDFKPGDEILFEGGKTFEGNLKFDFNDVGTPADTIKIGSYGGVRAVINAQNGDGIFIHNSMGFEILDLNIVGSGRDTNTGSGISVINDLTGDVKLDTIIIRNVEVYNFGDCGIIVDGNNARSGFRNVLIENADVHDNTVAGLYVYGAFSRFSYSYAHENVVIRKVKAYNNSGKSGVNRQHSGSGIVLSDTDGGVIEHSVAFNNGWLCNSDKGGPVGIWAWDSNNVVIQFNESYANKTGGTHDGGGFDLDGAMKNSVMQYNYSHDNDGAGFLVMQYTFGREYVNNTVRYNISVNDGRKNSYGGIHVWGDVQNSFIYNNTVYMMSSKTGKPRGIVVRQNDEPMFFENQFATNLQIINNIFVTDQEIPVVEAARSEKTVLFQNNNYYSGGSNLQIIWADDTFHTLADWRFNTGQEFDGEKKTGFAVDPLFQTVGNENLSVKNHSREELRQFCLKAGSLLTDAGSDIPKMLQIDVGRRDFFGTTVPQSVRYDIGACESF